MLCSHYNNAAYSQNIQDQANQAFPNTENCTIKTRQDLHHADHQR